MICYSVTDRHSFQEAVEYRKLITRVRASEDIPLVLVGNKFDLQHQRKVHIKKNIFVSISSGDSYLLNMQSQSKYIYLSLYNM
jgi:GTPase SAR1 family protein